MTNNNPQITIKVCTWLDRVTPESATDGDYSETGADWCENEYQSLTEAADSFVSALNEFCRENDPIVGQVVYDADGYDSDLSIGEKSFHCATIDVDCDYPENEFDHRPETKQRILRIERALQYLIDKRLGLLKPNLNKLVRLVRADDNLKNLEVFWSEFAEPQNDDDHYDLDPSEPTGSGHFYWFSQPGCLPDSEPFGPFNSQADALADALNQFGSNE